MDFWQQVRTAVEAGKSVTITFQAAHEVKIKRTRLRTRLPKIQPYRRYLGSTDGFTRPRCWNCETRLRANQSFACSDACEKEMLRQSCQVIALSKYGFGMFKRPDEYQPEIHGPLVLDRILKGAALQ